METSQANQGEEEFIDMEVNPSMKSREFEFQMCAPAQQNEATADELFYKGKLLPLHLPPRLKMVQKLVLQTSISPALEGEEEEEEAQEKCGTSLINCKTPLESRNVSPTESCRVSCELNPDEYLFQWSTEVRAFIGGDSHLSKKPWSKKMRLIKQSSLSEKLKSSRAYMKSLFTKPACSVEADCGKPITGGEEAWNVSKAKDYVSKYIKLVKKNPFGQMEDERHQVSSFTMKNILDSEMDDHTGFTCHRMSFSGAIKRHSTSKNFTSSPSNCSSSSSFSVKSANGFYEINLLKRSISANSEVENSIQGAIAHCKKSQQKQDISEEKRSESEVGTCLLSTSRVSACGGDCQRPDISRI